MTKATHQPKFVKIYLAGNTRPSAHDGVAWDSVAQGKTKAEAVANFNKLFKGESITDYGSYERCECSCGYYDFNYCEKK